MRFHKPIGILLLLWPTLWALWIAAHGFPSIKNLVIFVMGVVFMRAAGCVINDVADRQFDLYVARTKNRPITTGKISPKNALILFIVLCLMAFALVLFTNKPTILLAICAVLIATGYPFAKRYTHWPQVLLGIAFSFSIPMAFTAETGKLSIVALILMLANIAWTIAYDTQYAMTDRSDDMKIGIKSTAILFGVYDRIMVGLFQSIAILLLMLVGVLESFSISYFAAIFIAFLFMLYQHYLIARREPKKCFQAFLNNQWVGLVVFLGICFALL